MTVATFFTLCFGMLSSVQDATRVNQRNVQSELQLSLAVHETTLVLYEPVTLRIRLHNPGSQPISVLTSMTPGDGYLSLAIDGPGRFEARHIPRIARTVGIDPAILKPGASLEHDVVLDWTIGRRVFPETGTYTIGAALSVGGTQLHAHLLEVVIRSPAGVDLATLEAFDSRDAFRLLQSEGPPAFCREHFTGRSQACLAWLMQLLEQHHESVYAPWIAWSLYSALRWSSWKPEAEGDPLQRLRGLYPQISRQGQFRQ